MADKSCENCDIVQSLIDMNEKLRKTVVISTPPKQNEVVEVEISEANVTMDKVTKNVKVRYYINPNNSPKLVAWADERNMGKINIPELPKLLHDWYLEAVSKLNPTSFNPNANKAFDDLTPDQKYIDFYIAGKIIDKLKPPQQG